jgi:hypothetical protein
MRDKGKERWREKETMVRDKERWKDDWREGKENRGEEEYKKTYRTGRHILCARSIHRRKVIRDYRSSNFGV